MLEINSCSPVEKALDKLSTTISDAINNWVDGSFAFDIGYGISLNLTNLPLLEPMIISFYALSEDNDVDRFSSELFLKNIYLDKNKLFSFYGMNELSLQKNYFLYTDDTINDLLEDIRLVNNSTIVIDNPMVQAALINC